MGRDWIIETLEEEAKLYEKRCNNQLTGRKIYIAPLCLDKWSAAYSVRPSATTSEALLPVSSLRSKYSQLNLYAVDNRNFE